MKVFCLMLKFNLFLCTFFVVVNLIGSAQQPKKNDLQQEQQKFYSESEQKIKLSNLCAKSHQGENIHEELCSFLQSVAKYPAKTTIVNDVNGKPSFTVIDFTGGDSDEDEYDIIDLEKK